MTCRGAYSLGVTLCVAYTILSAAPALSGSAAADEPRTDSGEAAAPPLTHTYVVVVMTRQAPQAAEVSEEALRQTARLYANQLGPMLPKHGYTVVTATSTQAGSYCDDVTTHTCDLLTVEQSPDATPEHTQFNFIVKSRRVRHPVVEHDTIGKGRCHRPQETSRSVWEGCRYDVVPRFLSLFSVYEPIRHWEGRQ